MADIERSAVEVKKPEAQKPEDGKIEVIQGNIDFVSLRFLESINNNLNSIRNMIEQFTKLKPPQNG
jgi:CRISPR/Cas system-associated protein Cas10 (large subunit of type III CRISPR-Cas system)